MKTINFTQNNTDISIEKINQNKEKPTYRIRSVNIMGDVSIEDTSNPEVVIDFLGTLLEIAYQK